MTGSERQASGPATVPAPVRARPGTWLAALQRDLRLAFRHARRRPLLGAIIVLTLGLGIGASAAVFSIADRVLLRPLPYPEAERLVSVATVLADRPEDRTGLSAAVLLQLAGDTRVLAEVAASTGTQLVLGAPDGPVALPAAQVSWNYFRTLGVRPFMGGGFTAQEQDRQAARELVLAHGTWLRLFGGDAHVIGRSVLVNDVPYTVVGVMPAGFVWAAHEAWVPLDLTGFLASEERARRQRWFGTVGRLRPGATLAQAQGEMELVSRRLTVEHPAFHANERLTAIPLRDQIVGGVQGQVRVLMGAALLLLVVACANGAGVMVAQVLTRQQEFAVQTALGAGRARLARQLIMEALVLSAAGGGLGLLLAYYGAAGLHVLAGQFLPAVARPVIDARIVAAGLGASLLCGVVVGALPAALAARGSLAAVLRSHGRSATGGRAARRASGGLVVVQTSLCAALLVSAGLLGRSLFTLARADLGFDASNVLTFQLNLPRARYASDTAVVQFYEQLEDALRALPGVTAVASASGMPMAGGTRASLGIAGRDAPDGRLPEVAYYSVSDGYFDVLRVPLRRGRLFNARSGAREVVINESMARMHWPDSDPIGARVRLGPVQTGPWIDVVGVVEDMRDLGPADSLRAIAFGANRVFSWAGRGVLLRSAGDPQQHAAAVRRTVAELDPSLPIMQMRDYDEIRRADLARERLNSVLLGMFSAVSLLLAAVGIYGITASFVAARMREFGIRIALGASGRNVMAAAMRNGARLTAMGLALGMLLAMISTRLLAASVHGVRLMDPVVFIVVCLALVTAALLANWIPARRALRADPVQALRGD